MYKVKEYGFLLTDKNHIYTEKQFNELASNIRNLCYNVACKTAGYSIKHPFAMAANYEKNICASIYSDEKMIYFGIYDTNAGKISKETDVSLFAPGEVWCRNFAKRCDKRILEREKGYIRATIMSPELLTAWNDILLQIEKNIPSNVPYRDYEVAINPEPQFIEPEEKE